VNADHLRMASGVDLTAETLDALHVFADLVVKWTQRINLVSRGSIPDIWSRHIIDSAQLYPLSPSRARRFLDIGSGGGFPGLVLALIARQERPGSHMLLIESDQRKATFLREAVRLTAAPVDVISKRAEQVPAQGAEFVTARALAPLSDLLGYVFPHISRDGVAVLPKGTSAEVEIGIARNDWMFDLDVLPSQTDTSGRLLRITNLNRRIGSVTAT